MIVFYDFETTGLVVRHAPLSADCQPHIVQAAAIIVSDESEKIASFDLIARPSGWTIPEAASNIHGITSEKAARCGVSEGSIFALLSRFMRAAALRVAHNEAFDATILKIASYRFDDGGLAAFLDDIPAYCTMEGSRDICRIPGTERMVAAGIAGFKSPKLSEAYSHLFGEEMTNAHDALADVAACKRIYEHLVISERNAA